MASRALLISMIVTILLCGAVTRFPATRAAAARVLVPLRLERDGRGTVDLDRQYRSEKRWSVISHPTNQSVRRS